MRTCFFVLAGILLAFVTVFGTNGQATPADAVAKAFNDVRIAAHLPPLERMGINTFGSKVCAQDLRMPSGLINAVRYRTSDPSVLPDDAKKLAVKPDDGYRKAVRFGIGVCAVPGAPSGTPQFSVLIATYESRWMSFVRIFWE